MNILSETSLSRCRQNTFAFIVLFVLMLIIYSNTFDASWHFDDENNILNNKPLHLNELTIPNITQTFFADWNGSGRLYRPVACLSFALNYYFGGTDVTGYHVVNITIHYLCAFFLFLIIYETLNLPNLKQKYGNNSYFIALLSTVLWAVNPVQTQAVTYIVQRMTSMAALFYIMAMYLYLKGRTSRLSASKWACYLLCAICGLLALVSKENAVTLPVTLLIYNFLIVKGPTKKNTVRYSFLFLIMLAAGISVVLLIKGPSIFDPSTLVAGYQNRAFSLTERLLTEPRVILFYISLLLYPMPNRLCLEHDIALSTSLLTPISTILSIGVILIILCGAVAGARKWPLISFCIIFFFLNHLIEASILPLELIFEHRNYLPSMLFFVPLSILLARSLQFFSGKRALQVALVTFLVLLLIGWGHSTYARNRVWKTQATLTFDCLEKYPNLGRPHHNLGRLYMENNLYEAAINEFLIALSKKYMNNLAGKNWTYYDLGSIYQTIGNDERALFYYDQAQKYQPHFAPTHIRKGQIFLKKGLYGQSAEEFRKALKSRDHRALALTHLGHLSLRTGQIDRAVDYLQQASEISPQDPDIMRRLGLAYRIKNKEEKAIFLFESALNIDPNAPYTLLEAANIYTEKGLGTKAKHAMDRFFAIFDGSITNLKIFIDGMNVRVDSTDLFDRHQEQLLRFLSTALAERGQQYRALAETCCCRNR